MELRLQQDPINGLARFPVQIRSEWVSKLSATRPPDYLPRVEYTLHCHLSAEAPFLLVWLVSETRRLDHLRDLLEGAGTGFDVALLHLDDWERDQPVALGFGGELVGIDNPAELQTGTVYDWAIDPPPLNTVHKALLVARSDVENVRGRWRLKPALWPALPPYLAFLQHGRRTGTVRVNA